MTGPLDYPPPSPGEKPLSKSGCITVAATLAVVAIVAILLVQAYSPDIVTGRRDVWGAVAFGVVLSGILGYFVAWPAWQEWQARRKAYVK